jgi:hypothetical protein
MLKKLGSVNTEGERGIGAGIVSQGRNKRTRRVVSPPDTVEQSVVSPRIQPVKRARAPNVSKVFKKSKKQICLDQDVSNYLYDNFYILSNDSKSVVNSKMKNFKNILDKGELYELPSVEYFPDKLKEIMERGLDEIKKGPKDVYNRAEILIQKYKIPTQESVCKSLSNASYSDFTTDEMSLKKTLNIVLSDVNSIRCPICFASFIKYIPNSKQFQHLSWVIEHEHRYKGNRGPFRGKICSACNSFLRQIDEVMNDNKSMTVFLNLPLYAERVHLFETKFKKSFLDHIVSLGIVPFGKQNLLRENTEWFNIEFENKEAKDRSKMYSLPIQIFKLRDCTGPVEDKKIKSKRVTGKVKVKTCTVDDIENKKNSMNFDLDNLVISEMPKNYSLLHSLYDQVYDYKLVRMTLPHFISALKDYAKMVIENDNVYKRWCTELKKPNPSSEANRLTIQIFSKWHNINIVVKKMNKNEYEKEVSLKFKESFMCFGALPFSTKIKKEYKIFVPSEGTYGNVYPVPSHLLWNIFLNTIFISFNTTTGHYDSLIIEFPQDVLRNRFDRLTGQEFEIEKNYEIEKKYKHPSTFDVEESNNGREYPGSWDSSDSWTPTIPFNFPQFSEMQKLWADRVAKSESGSKTSRGQKRKHSFGQKRKSVKRPSEKLVKQARKLKIRITRNLNKPLRRVYKTESELKREIRKCKKIVKSKEVTGKVNKRKVTKRKGK